MRRAAARRGFLARRSTVRTPPRRAPAVGAALSSQEKSACLVKTKTAALAAAAAALSLAAVGAPGASAAPGTSTPGAPAPQAEKPQTDPALFQVGTSVVDITPKTPMADGGYGSNYIVTGGAHDPLQVRAFFVGHGKQAVVFESVDSQGWFAAYQAPNAGDGADDARREAAAALTARGYDVTRRRHRRVGHARPRRSDPDGTSGATPTRPTCTRSRTAAVQAVLDAESNAPPGGAVVCDRHHSRPALAGPGNRPDGRVRRRRSAADPVGPRAGHRRDDRHVRQRAGPRRSVRPDRGRATTSGAPTTPGTSARVCPSCSAAPRCSRRARSVARRRSALTRATTRS